MREEKSLRAETIIRLFYATTIATNILMAIGVGILAWQLLR